MLAHISCLSINHGPLQQVKTLLLSYQNILKINNLVGFDKLVKLQLDNNIIEKIEHLSQLTCVHSRSRCASHARRVPCARLAMREGQLATLNRVSPFCWILLRSRSLEALDLSFNNISEIGGLASLTNLTTLSLFSNRVTQLCASLWHEFLCQSL